MRVSPHPEVRRVNEIERGGLVVAYYAPFIKNSNYAAFAASGRGAERHGVTTLLVTASNHQDSGLWSDDKRKNCMPPQVG